MTVVARLQIESVEPPWAWTWRVEIPGGTVSTRRVEFDPASAVHQALVDRPPDARGDIGELRAAMRALIGADLADQLVRARLSVLHVHGGRPTPIALHLPFEALFSAPAPLVVRHVRRSADGAGPPVLRGILAAFSNAGSPYLPLHAEAAALAERSQAANVPYEELFVAWTSRDLLERGAGREIVHIAGHGSAGKIVVRGDACGTLTSVGSQQLIEAWKSSPPGLVVLNTCDGSSARDHTPLFRDTVGTSMAHIRREAAAVGAREIASSSLAIDLAAALGTSVVSMTTSVSDSVARRFSASFYQLLLQERRPLDEAFRLALVSSDAFGESGLPVPALFMGSMPRRRVDQTSPPAPTLPAKLRQLAGLHGEAAGSMAWAGRSGWCGAIAGADADVAAETVNLVRKVLAQRNVPSDDVDVKDMGAAGTMILTPQVADSEEMILALFQPDWVPSDVVAGDVELLELTPYESELVAVAVCQVPALLAGLGDLDVGALTSRLRAVARNRDGEGDRRLPLDLAESLVDGMPTAIACSVRHWSEAQWRQVLALGPLAVDVASATFLLSAANSTHQDLFRKFDALVNAGIATADEVDDTFHRLGEAGVFYGSSGKDGLSADIVRVDGLTAARAWANCSEAAVAAWLAADLDDALAHIYQADFFGETGETAAIALAQRCLQAQDPRVWALIEMLTARGRPDRAAALAQAAVAQEIPMPETRTALDDQLDLAFTTGNHAEARALIEAVPGTLAQEDPFWQSALLALEAGSADPAELLERAVTVVDALTAEFARPDRISVDRFARAHSNVATTRIAAYERLGDVDAAVQVAVYGWRETLELGAPWSRLAHAAGLAAGVLLRHQRDGEARAIIDATSSAGGEPRPTAAHIHLQTLHVRTLVKENRLPLLRREAETLLRVLRAWRVPHLGVVEHAMYALGAAELQLDREAASIAWTAIADCLAGREPSEILLGACARIRDGSHTEDKDLDDAVRDVGRQLTPVLERLSVSPRGLDVSMEQWMTALAQRSGDPLAVLGPQRAAGLRARIAAGCPVAANASRGLAGVPDVDCRIEANWDVETLATLAREHGSLAEILRPTLSDRFAAGLPIFRRAYLGDSDAHVALCALTSSDHGPDAPHDLGAYVRAALERAPLKEMARLTVGLDGKFGVQAALQLEACVVDSAGDWDTETTAELEELAMEIWPALFVNAGLDETHARHLLDLLVLTLGSTEAVAEAATATPQAGGWRRETLCTLFRADLRARAQMAVVMARDGELDHGLRLIPATTSGDVNRLLATVAARMAACRAAGDEARAHIEASDLRRFDPDELDEDGRAALDEIATATLEIGAYSASLIAHRLRIRQPLPADKHPLDHHMAVTLRCALNITALILMTDDDGLVEHLAAVSQAFGVASLCWSIGGNARNLRPEQTVRVAELIAVTARSEELGPYDPLLDLLSRRLLEAIVDLEAWSEAVEAIRKRQARVADASSSRG